jgi:alpha-beta hydrolase superfamily lysophospholipase
VARRALWFGPPGRPLFARVYVPSGGAARGAVVLCPPLGLEAQGAGRAYRALGDQLEGQGFVVLHFDYDGTGDSAGSQEDPGRVKAWQASVTSAVDFVRAGGARHVCVVAMRLGATLAASVAADCELDALVLWDPCDSGRSYLREQALLREVYMKDEGLACPPEECPPGTAAGVETLGTVYTAETVQAMSELRIDSAAGVLGRRVLALFRPERPPRAAVRERLSGDHVEFADAIGQEELLNVWPLLGLVPQRSLDGVVTWLSRAVGPETSSFSVPCPQVAVIASAGGEEVVEEIRHLGPNQLFGILTRPVSPAPGVTAVLLNSGRLDHLGPGRLWVSLARSWARAGLAVLRVDLGGLGDSPVRAGREPELVYPPDAIDDISEVAQAISPGGPSGVVLIGLCSGARHSLSAGAEIGARGVVAVNPVFRPGPPGQPKAARLAPSRPLRRWRRAGAAAKEWAGRFAAYRPLARAARWLLDAKWWVAKRARYRTRPAGMLRRLVVGGVDTMVICRRYEANLISRGEKSTLRRLRKKEAFHMEVLLGIDHTLYLEVARAQVVPILTEHMASLNGRAIKGPLETQEAVEEKLDDRHRARFVKR